MTMHWTSYLVRLHPEVDTMDERMERAHRGEVIMDRFIRPQADEIALAYETKNVFQRLIRSSPHEQAPQAPGVQALAPGVLPKPA